MVTLERKEVNEIHHSFQVEDRKVKYAGYRDSKNRRFFYDSNERVLRYVQKFFYINILNCIFSRFKNSTGHFVDRIPTLVHFLGIKYDIKGGR